MAQIPVRLNTQGMSFPLLTRQAGRTVISPQGDLTYVPGVNTDGDVPQTRGIPDIMYCHNVMPSIYGWQSVGYEDKTNPLPVATNVQRTFFIQGAEVTGDNVGSSGLRARIARVTESGSSTLYILNSSGTWVQLSGTPTFGAAAKISTALINGYSYVAVPGFGVYVVDVAAQALIPRTLAGLTQSSIDGVFTSNGYLLVWTVRSVVWSSVTDPEDFVPSDVSGAGGGSIQDAEGDIIYCSKTPTGFLVFTDTNCVAAVYTANEDFPFEYRILQDVGGLSDPNLLSTNTVASNYYAITSNGIQRISQTSGRSVLPNVSDFIHGNIFEDFNETTNTLTTATLNNSMGKAIEVVGNRYVVVSYAANSVVNFTHAIVIDVLQSRMGKLKVFHRQCFEYQDLQSGTAVEARNSLAFVDQNGVIKVVKFDIDCEETTGVLILGKLQLLRQRFIELQEVELESVCPANNFLALTYPSLDGKTLLSPIEGFLNPEDNSKILKRYYFSSAAQNHTLLFKGAFDLSSIVIHFTLHGRQ